MNAVDRFLAELEAALHLRGRMRRRLLIECRDHLVESGAEHGPDEAVRRFGRAADLACSFELEVAASRALLATVATAAGVLGLGFTALAMLNAADTEASAPVGWTVVFFASAQVSGVCLFLAVLRAAAMRRETATASDVGLLCRRNATALGFAFLTPFSVGAAVPGHTAAWKVLAGPAIAVVAAFTITRVQWLIHTSAPRPSGVVRAPWTDVATLVGRSIGALDSVVRLRAGLVVPLVLLLAASAAFIWDLLDHGTVTDALSAAAIEAAMTMTGYLFLGRGLGLHTAGLAN